MLPEVYREAGGFPGQFGAGKTRGGGVAGWTRWGGLRACADLMRRREEYAARAQSAAGVGAPAEVQT